jgi:hypothetical protein
MRWLRYVLLVAFTALAVASLYCFMHLEQGILLENIVRVDSYFHKVTTVTVLNVCGRGQTGNY